MQSSPAHYSKMETSMGEDFILPEPDRKQPLRSYILPIISALAAIGLTLYFVLESDVYVYKRPKTYNNYRASLRFTIPYADLVEDIEVYTLGSEGSQRLSYYNGTNTYIYNKNSTGYEMYPIIDRMGCFSTEGEDVVLATIFPDTRGFRHVDDEIIGNITCNVYKISLTQVDSVSSYIGNYTYYTDKSNGVPIQFHYVGHNTFLGGSHVDEYLMEYLEVEEVCGTCLNQTLFQDPSLQLSNGVTCEPLGGDDDGGGGPKLQHTGAAAAAPPRHSPAMDLTMLFPTPVAHAARRASFSSYLETHNRVYSPSRASWDGASAGAGAGAGEHGLRHAAYHSNVRYINAVNRQGRSFYLAANHMTDWTAEERLSLLGHRHSTTTFNQQEQQQQQQQQKPLPQQQQRQLQQQQQEQQQDSGLQISVEVSGGTGGVDWRLRGGVTAVKDQGTCGSCWAFGATGALEGAWFAAKGELLTLSEQALVDCSWNYGNQGCNGGLVVNSYHYLLADGDGDSGVARQLPTTDSYGPYRNMPQYCHVPAATSSSSTSGNDTTTTTTTSSDNNAVIRSDSDSGGGGGGVTISGWEAVVSGNWSLFNEALERRPLAVAIMATPPSFYFYAGGVYDDPLCLGGEDDLDHAVLAVGYVDDETNGKRSTIVKNSWSTHWGEDGYLRIAQEGNICGVATSPSFVTTATTA